MLTTCPHCSVSVNPSRLERHIKKIHTSRSGVTAPSVGSRVSARPRGRGGFRLCTCEGSNENCRYCYGTGSAKINAAGRPSRRGYRGPRIEPAPPVKEPLVHLPPLEPDGGSWRTINVVSRRPKGYAPALPKPAPTTPPRPKRDRRGTCPKCGHSIRESRLDGHLRRPHSADWIKTQSSPKQPQVIKPQPQDKRFRTKPLRPVRAGGGVRQDEDDARYESPQAVRAMDHTRGYAHAFRDQGRYGSHPSHDGFDDESNP